jgi:hypothetical protein
MLEEDFPAMKQDKLLKYKPHQRSVLKQIIQKTEKQIYQIYITFWNTKHLVYQSFLFDKKI